MNHPILNSRQRKIISILCNNNDFITTSQIANLVGVSSRTITRSMKNIEKWFQKKNIALIKKTRVGIKIDESLEEKNNLLNILREEEIYKIYTPEERRLIMTLELLEKKKITKLLYFSNYFKVSNSTISKDLDITEKWLKKYNLKLIRKQGFGITVEGEEKNFRKAIIYLLYDNTKVYELRKFIQNSVENSKIPKESNQEVRKRLLNLIDQETLNDLEGILDDGEKKLNYELADSAYIGLLVHLAIAIKRISNGEEIVIDKEYFLKLSKSQEFSVARSIANNIVKRFKIKMPESEIGYITMHLKGAKLRNGNFSDGNLLSDSENIIGNYELTKIVLKMLDKIKNLSGYDLKSDKKLLIGLISHLRPALSRIRMKMDIRNPLLEQVKLNYPDIYSLSEKAVVVIENWTKLKIPDSEIGFLAMHIGASLEKRKMLNKKIYNIVVTCSSGVGTSSLLASKISKEYKNINIIGSSSIRKLETLIKGNSIDFVVSTVNIENLDIPYVKVSPLLLMEDKKLIKSLMEEVTVPENRVLKKINNQNIDKNVNFQKLNEAIYKLINNFYFNKNIIIDTKEELIDEISKILSKGNFEIEKDIKNSLIYREKIGSTIVTEHNILLLHSKTEVFNELTFGVIRLEKGILINNYKNEEINIKNVLIMLANKKASKTEIQLLSYISKLLIENIGFVNSLIESTKEEVKSKLISVLNEYMREQII